jgi:hypothetical protein
VIRWIAFLGKIWRFTSNLDLKTAKKYRHLLADCGLTQQCPPKLFGVVMV